MKKTGPHSCSSGTKYPSGSDRKTRDLMDMYQTSTSIRHRHISGINSEHVGKSRKDAHDGPTRSKQPWFFEPRFGGSSDSVVTVVACSANEPLARSDGPHICLPSRKLGCQWERKKLWAAFSLPGLGILQVQGHFDDVNKPRVDSP